MCAYYSQYAHKQLAARTQRQWDAYMFCRAVKYGRLNGSLTFPWKKGPEIITQLTVGRARWIFGVYILDTLKKLGLDNAILVPLPSKDGLLDAPSFRSYVMLQEALQSHQTRVIIAPHLRFIIALQPAHLGGPRGREVISQYLRLIAELPPGPVVIVDDIITTGGSLLAAYDVLEMAGRPPAAAIVCGHTVADSLISAFGHHTKNIDTAPQAIDF